MSPSEAKKRERVVRAAREAAEQGCLCTGPKPTSLCPYRSPPDGFFQCCRHEGHEGDHVACAGPLGPHAISVWGPKKRRRKIRP